MRQSAQLLRSGQIIRQILDQPAQFDIAVMVEEGAVDRENEMMRLPQGLRVEPQKQSHLRTNADRPLLLWRASCSVEYPVNVLGKHGPRNTWSRLTPLYLHASYPHLRHRH